MLFTKNTQNTLKISPGHSYLPLTVIAIECVHQTGPRKAAQHRAICYSHASCLPSLSLCQKWELFLSSIDRTES